MLSTFNFQRTSGERNTSESDKIWISLKTMPFAKWIKITSELDKLLLLEEILHHLGWLKPYKSWDNHHPWWCRISASYRMTHSTWKLQNKKIGTRERNPPFNNSRVGEFVSLDGGFNFYLFSPLFGEDFQFDYFQRGWNHQLVSHPRVSPRIHRSKVFQIRQAIVVSSRRELAQLAGHAMLRQKVLTLEVGLEVGGVCQGDWVFVFHGFLWGFVMDYPPGKLT